MREGVSPPPPIVGNSTAPAPGRPCVLTETQHPPRREASAEAGRHGPAGRCRHRFPPRATTGWSIPRAATAAPTLPLGPRGDCRPAKRYRHMSPRDRTGCDPPPGTHGPGSSSSSTLRRPHGSADRARRWAAPPTACRRCDAWPARGNVERIRRAPGFITCVVPPRGRSMGPQAAAVPSRGRRRTEVMHRRKRSRDVGIE